MKTRDIPPMPYSLPTPVATLHGPGHVHLVPDDDTRARIAVFAGLHAVDAMDVQLRLAPRADGLIRMTGKLEAKVQPICVVSLEPFVQVISTEVAAAFAPASLIEAMAKRIRDEKIEHPEDLPDEIVDGAIDPAGLAVEALILALDPYPKKPGIAFGGHEEAAEAISPFVALKALKLDKEG